MKVERGAPSAKHCPGGQRPQAIFSLAAALRFIPCLTRKSIEGSLMMYKIAMPLFKQY